MAARLGRPQHRRLTSPATASALRSPDGGKRPEPALWTPCVLRSVTVPFSSQSARRLA